MTNGPRGSEAEYITQNATEASYFSAKLCHLQFEILLSLEPGVVDRQSETEINTSMK